MHGLNMASEANVT